MCLGKCRLSVVNFFECVVWRLMCLSCVLVAVWCCEELLCLVCACDLWSEVLF